MPGESGNDEQRAGKTPGETNEEAEKKDIATTALQTLGGDAVAAKRDIATTAVQSLGVNAVDAKKEIATTALQTLSPEQMADVIGQVSGPTQEVRDRLAQWMSAAGVLLLTAGLLFAGIAAVRLFNTPMSWDNAPTEGEISQTVSFYLPIFLVPVILLFAAALASVVGYLLMRAGGAATSEFIPEKDREMVGRILLQAAPKEAMDEYVRLRSLSGISGFFTKMKLSGLPLATITLTLIFTFLAIWSEAFFDLAKLTLGVFLGSYVQQHAGPERQP
jgi:hypothetical protein